MAPRQSLVESAPKESDFNRLVVIALGSNLGDSTATVLRAMERLNEFSQRPILKSSLWETTPVDCPPGSPRFVNAVLGLVPCPGESPETLHAKLQALEKEFGRQPKAIMNEARPLDLDLITFGKEIGSSLTLILPHPRACERRFVIEPLSEIAPDLVLPGQNRTVIEILSALPPDPNMRRLNQG